MHKDVIDMLTAASSEKLMIKDNRVYKSMDIQLLDKRYLFFVVYQTYKLILISVLYCILKTHNFINCLCSGMKKCYLVGDVVDMMSEYLCADWVRRPVVALRFVEIRKTNGEAFLKLYPIRLSYQSEFSQSLNHV